MGKVYLNMKSSQVRETVDEFIKEEAQSSKEFRLYVRQMIKEYQMAGMNVYISSRKCSNWN